MKYEVEINGKPVRENIDYTVREGTITIINESLLPVRTIAYSKVYEPNRAQRRKYYI